MHQREKITILPLRSADQNLFNCTESISLGSDLSVERCASLLASADLSIWKHDAGKHDMEEIGTWDICLVHRYLSGFGTVDDDQYSIRLLGFVLAHLRLIRPHRDSTDDYIQLQFVPAQSSYEAFRCAKAAFRPNRFLCDCENLIWGISRPDLDRLRILLPWILEFTKNWEKYYPLWLSLYFFEQAYLPNNTFRIAHLFRVMALEALFCTETSFGKKALMHRISKLLGIGLDLYEPYKVDFLQLPYLPLTSELIKDIYTCRNKIAHSDSLPASWKDTVIRRGLNENISYLAQLLEAATSICRLAWLRILEKELQETFSDKLKMQAYLD